MLEPNDAPTDLEPVVEGGFNKRRLGTLQWLEEQDGDLVLSDWERKWLKRERIIQ